MANEAGWKLLQKQTYDVLSHRYGSLALATVTVLLIVSILQFGEQWLEWSQDKYTALFNSFNDNISGRSFQRRLCLPVPIDVVYTWVNGTDPKLVKQLRRYKLELESEVNATSDDECTFAHCVSASVVVMVRPSGKDNQSMNLEMLHLAHPIFLEAKKLNVLQTGGDSGINVTVVHFEDDKKAKTAAHQKIKYNGHNISVQQGFLSSDWTIPNSILLKDTIMLTGFPHELTVDQLKLKLPERHQKAIEKIDLNGDKGIAVLFVPNKEEFEYILQEHNITIEGKEPTFNAANLVWDLSWNNKRDDIGANRFEDNEELRYSLRSVERHAPWVRHIFIVTNGQIPSWLNLDNPRLTIVTHEQLFPNSSHLPTFSSPAIEAHLHRIPGLSNKFIYLNDDVMFGKDVWPDDFYTHSNGQKVYLTWPVPNCQEGCPSTWIKDGYCDKACNNSECEWDGGDCVGGGKQPYQFDGGHNVWNTNSDELYCNTGCANNWIADRYCDQACNVKPCGFDAGDCGIKRFSFLHGVDLDPGTTVYSLPKGEAVAWFNLTGIFGSNCSVEEGSYDENEAIRVATIAQKFKTMTLVVFDKYNLTTLQFSLNGKCSPNATIQFNFTVAVDPKPVKKVNTTNDTALSLKHEIDANGTLKVVTNVTKNKFKFVEVPVELQSPKSVVRQSDIGALAGINMSQYELPENIDERYNSLLQQFLSGEITEKGFGIRQAVLWQEYSEQIAAEGKQPVKKTVTEQPDNVQKPLEQHENIAQQAIEQPANGQQHQVNIQQPLQVDDQQRQQRQQQQDNIHQQPVEQLVNAQQQQLNSIQQQQINGQQQLNEQVDVQHMQQQQQQSEKNAVNDDNKAENVNIEKQHEMKQFEDQQKVKFEEGGVLKQQRDGINNADNVQQQVIQDNKTKDNADNLQDAYAQDKSFKSRKLNMVRNADLPSPNDIAGGSLPWERRGVFDKLMKQMDAIEKQREFETVFHKGRQLLDTFGDSLRHVNKLYNKMYGVSARKVPAHMPHFVDKNILAELQNKFPKEWDVTSSHKIRSSDDMQFAFSYMYYLMSEPEGTTVQQVFAEYDNDHSGILSDREIRTMATRLYDLPLDLQTLTGLEKMLINCSAHLPPELLTMPLLSRKEAYYDKEMPQVTEYLILHCEPIIDLMRQNVKQTTKYKFEILGDDEIAFKMIHTNVSHVVGQLDDVRKNPKKFICLNDNIDHGREEAKTVKAVLADFYESAFPIPSSFELPREYRNRFLTVDELREWRKYRDWLKIWTHLALFLLITFTVGSFFSDKLDAIRRKILGRRLTQQTGGAAAGREAVTEAVQKPLLTV